MGDLSLIPLTLAGVSAGGNFVVIILALLFGFRRQLLIKRVSIRLQVLICFADLAKNGLLFMSLLGEAGGGCSALGFLSLMAGHTYVLLVLSLAVNAQFVLLSNFPPKERWLTWYWLTPCIVAALLNLPLWGWNAFGENVGGVCFIREGHHLLELIYVYVIYTIVFVYCCVISVLVLIKVRRNPNALLSLRGDIDPTGLRNKEAILRSVAKLMPTSVTFPLVLCISVAFANGCLAIDYFTNSHNPLLYTWGNFGFNTIGLLNFLAFIADPLVRKAVLNLPKYRNAIQEYPLESARPGQKFLENVCYADEAENLSASPDKLFIRNFINAT